MKKNFLVTTGLINAWEFEENNYLLGKWCEFYEVDNYDKKKDKSIKLSEIHIKKNKNHWDDKEKKLTDFNNLVTIIDTILPIISEKLSKVHNVNETEEYWHNIIHPWLKEYTYAIFDRWQHIKIFFERNENKKFYTNVFQLNDLDYQPKNHYNFMEITQTHEWNHLVFLRLIDFYKFKNISLKKKKYIENEFNNKKKKHSNH